MASETHLQMEGIPNSQTTPAPSRDETASHNHIVLNAHPEGAIVTTTVVRGFLFIPRRALCPML